MAIVVIVRRKNDTADKAPCGGNHACKNGLFSQTQKSVMAILRWLVALEEEMAALNHKNSADAGLICKRVAEVQLKVFRKLRLEEFVTHLIDVIKNELSFHYSFLFPQINGDHNKKILAVKTFVNLIQAPASEGLDEAFFTDYLETTCKELINIVFEKMAMDDFAKTAIQTQNFPQQALDVAMAVLKDFLQYFTVVTRDLQNYS